MEESETSLTKTSLDEMDFGFGSTYSFGEDDNGIFILELTVKKLDEGEGVILLGTGELLLIKLVSCS